jgi:hypothetical protein
LAKTVVLFDLDGVLIKSGGYRAAFHGAMDYFLGQMGLRPEVGPDEHDLVKFESYGVTAEWDMLPLSLAILFERFCELFHEDLRLMNLTQALEWVASHAVAEISVDYEGAINQMGPFFWSTPIPAGSILLACRNGQGGLLFPNLSRQPLLGQLLSNTRGGSDSMTTRILQNFQLGDQVFEQAYQIPAEVKTKSTLQMNDSPLLSEANGLELQNLFDLKRIYLAYLTLRPSYPPMSIELNRTGYSPEAEIALERTNLSKVPMVAYGHMQYLASQLGTTAESLVKPYPYQALAGIKAAIEGEDLPALLWTGKIYKIMQHTTVASKCNLDDLGEIGLPNDLDIHIFEDMPVGIQSTRTAVDILKGFGISARFTAWGITQDHMMEAVLKAQGAQVFGDTNQAVQEFLKLISH